MKLEDRSIFASRLDAPLNFDTCKILYPASLTLSNVDPQSTLLAHTSTSTHVCTSNGSAHLTLGAKNAAR